MPLPDIKYTLTGQETITMTGQSVDNLLHAGDGDAALLYLYILKTQGRGAPAEAAAAMNKSAESIANAMATLAKLGLIRYDGPSGSAKDLSPAEPRRYSVSELTREMEISADFSSLVEEVQRSLGKLLSPDDLERLFSVYDSLRMPSDVILQLVTHCIKESRGRDGGRMPSMRYIEKEAYIWDREGIFSLDRAEEYLKALESRKSAQGEIKRVLQINDRELSSSEKRYIDGWILLGYEPEAIEEAYDRTILNTGKPALAYMNSIINKWHAKNLHTISEILEKDNRSGKNNATAKPKAAAQKFGAPDTEDIKRMERILRKIKED